MSNPKFIIFGSGIYAKTVALDNIAFAEMHKSGAGSRIVLKQVINGNNETIDTTDSLDSVNAKILQALSQIKQEQQQK